MSTYLLSEIGGRLKAIRKQQERKLVEVSAKAGVSKGLLSKVENGRTVPSLPVLLSIIKSLGLQPSEFFEGMDYNPPSKYIHKQEKDHVLIHKEAKAKGFHYNLILDKTYRNTIIEAVLLQLEPDAKRSPVISDVCEFKYLLSGKVDYHFGEEVVSLKPGDSLIYDGKGSPCPGKYRYRRS